MFLMICLVVLIVFGIFLILWLSEDLYRELLDASDSSFLKRGRSGTESSFWGTSPPRWVSEKKESPQHRKESCERERSAIERKSHKKEKLQIPEPPEVAAAGDTPSQSQVVISDKNFPVTTMSFIGERVLMTIFEQNTPCQEAYRWSPLRSVEDCESVTVSSETNICTQEYDSQGDLQDCCLCVSAESDAIISDNVSPNEDVLFSRADARLRQHHKSSQTQEAGIAEVVMRARFVDTTEYAVPTRSQDILDQETQTVSDIAAIHAVTVGMQTDPELREKSAPSLKILSDADRAKADLQQQLNRFDKADDSSLLSLPIVLSSAVSRVSSSSSEEWVLRPIYAHTDSNLPDNSAGAGSGTLSAQRSPSDPQDEPDRWSFIRLWMPPRSDLSDDE